MRRPSEVLRVHNKVMNRRAESESHRKMDAHERKNQIIVLLRRLMPVLGFASHRHSKNVASDRDLWVASFSY